MKRPLWDQYVQTHNDFLQSESEKMKECFNSLTSELYKAIPLEQAIVNKLNNWKAEIYVADLNEMNIVPLEDYIVKDLCDEQNEIFIFEKIKQDKK